MYKICIILKWGTYRDVEKRRTYRERNWKRKWNEEELLCCSEWKEKDGLTMKRKSKLSSRIFFGFVREWIWRMRRTARWAAAKASFRTLRGSPLHALWPFSRIWRAPDSSWTAASPFACPCPARAPGAAAPTAPRSGSAAAPR